MLPFTGGRRTHSFGQEVLTWANGLDSWGDKTLPDNMGPESLPGSIPVSQSYLEGS